MTARRIRPSELLDLADLLAGRRAGAGRPRTLHLRQAVSCAYYALFHDLCLHAADRLGAGPRDGAGYSEVVRWFAHSDLRALSDAVLSHGTPSPRPVTAALRSVDPDLRRIVEAFGHLQDERHRADYDHSYDIRKSFALAAVDESRDAIGRLRRLVRDGEPSCDVFLRMMVGAVKVAKKR